MQELEKILEEIDKATDEYGMVDYINHKPVISKNQAKDIIRKYMKSGKDTDVSTNDGWIPVEEALPEEDGIYIIDDRAFNSPWIHTAGFKVSSKAWCENHGVYYDDKYGRYEDGRVIAWQPLPEPYKAERSE